MCLNIFLNETLLIFMQNSAFTSILSLVDHTYLSEELRHLRKIGLESLIDALNAVLPHNLISNSISLCDTDIRIDTDIIPINSFSKILIIGGGKATGKMCEAVLQIFKDRFPLKGLINVPYGQKFPTVLQSPLKKAQVRVNFCAHPVPDEAGMKGVQEMLRMIENSPADTLVIALISGGGSALMPLPAPGISMNKLQAVNKLLLESGATIQEINCVRKHLSAFKGGQLARVVSPRKLISLIISDVIGNDLQSIASGPTVPDNTTFQDAKTICDHYSIFHQFSPSIQQRILEGIKGTIEDTPKSGDSIFSSSETYIIGSAATSAKVALESLHNQGFFGEIFSHALQGEAKEFGKDLISIINNNSHEKRPKILIGTGEFTVTLQGKGKGGRNQEMLLGFLCTLIQNPSLIPKNCCFVLISGAFDGIEGNSPAMGAIVDSSSLARVQKLGLEPSSYLQRNDSYRFFQKLGDSIVTGQTGTNVNDMLLVLIGNAKKE
jgi:glycerate 2-kinase